MLTFGSKLNRSYTMYIPFMNDHIEVSVLFNKSNTFVGFNTDQRIYQMHRNNEVHSQIYKDLKESVFAATFLDLRNFKSRNLDIRQQFNNVLPPFQDKIQYEANETIKVSKVKTNLLFESKYNLKSCLSVLLFKIILKSDHSLISMSLIVFL